MNDRKDKVDSYSLETLKALAEVAQDEYQRECWRQEVLEKKAVNLLGFSGVMTTISASIGAFLLGKDILRPEYINIFEILFFGSVTFLAVSAIISLAVIRLQKYRTMLLDTIVTENNMGASKELTYYSMAMIYRELVLGNKEKEIVGDKAVNNHKAKILKASFWFLSIALVLIILEALAMVMGTF
ncbi:MAG: hypothetical protein SWK76_17190 [Actinomycetota bacterium]|nr:hypothetical protein [Actinomycetota bacterium]